MKPFVTAVLMFAALCLGVPQVYEHPTEECEVVVMVKDEVKAVTEPTKASVPATVYTIHGITPPIEWQTSLRNELKRCGIEWYMPYAVCQVFQESRWNQYADNGRDKGITQQKGIYWDARAARYGVGGASVWDVKAQFRVYACMMSEYLRSANGNVGWALSLYFYGNGEYAEKYVADVLSHLDYLKEVK